MISDPRHRARFRQLWVDKAREQLGRFGCVNSIELNAKINVLAQMTGSSNPMADFVMLPTPELTNQLKVHGLSGSMRDIALRALKSQGYPQRELGTPEDQLQCAATLGSTLNWLAFDILLNPLSRIMLLDDRTAKAVVDSKNDAITAAELQHLPHNPCLIEFYRPIEIAEQVKRGIRLCAVGFESLGDPEAPSAAVCFYLDLWQTNPSNKTRSPATIGIWFGGFNMLTIDKVIRRQFGFEMESEIEDEITDVCLLIARNLWDFVTSRSIRYEQIPRKPARHSTKNETKPIQELHSPLDREVTLLFLSRECSSSGRGDSDTQPTQRDYRIAVPGTFHEFVYCAKCGDLHRHDLLGQACRKCSEKVGPRANARVEKYWHSPYIKGPDNAPLKEVVRDIHRRKPRR